MQNVGSKLDKIIESQSVMQTQQAVMATDMKHLIADNVEFKVETERNATALKIQVYKTKEIVLKHSIWFTIIHFLTVTLVGFFTYKSM